MAEDADGHQQQLAIRHHGGFLLQGHLLKLWRAISHSTCQIDEVQAQDARQGHIALVEHALEAGFREIQHGRQICEGVMGGFELFFQGEDKVGSRPRGLIM